jgi:rhodanese-related sulfurtransferase
MKVERMKIHDFVDQGLGHSSYLIDVGNGIVALVDPPRFPTVHETLAAELGLRIDWTFDTHSHADYVTGSPGVAARPTKSFASGHIAGSMSNTLRPAFASWLGWLVTAGQPIVLVLDESITTSELPVGTLTIMCGHGERAMTAAGLITATRHHDLVVLDGGPDTWSTAAQIPLEIGR